MPTAVKQPPTLANDAAHVHALPATGVLLIGTPATIRELATALKQLDQTCIPAGCIMTDRFASAREDSAHADIEPLPALLGFIDDLAGLQARFRFKLALVSFPAEQSRALVRARGALDRLDIPCRTIPTRSDLLLGRFIATPAAGRVIPGSNAPAAAAVPTISIGREIDPTTLIGRSQATINRDEIARIITGKRVLVTGAGGSIGSELARVCAEFSPSSLLLMERAENALFQIDHQIARRFPAITRRGLLHDANDAEQTLRVMLEHRPQVVFHAAAHKHVPLMEDHPALAVGNNLFATKSVADAATACGAERFVLISSDKAVNPTSVMGATKRLAELYIASLAPSTQTRFSMVRFGNVLASACSVVPIWSQQLADGGPLTITDPRMTRYFMTIPEAAALVVQAAALDQPIGQAPVYVLDMGKPVRILDLAQRFAAMHGYRPRIGWTPQTAGLIRNDPNAQTNALVDEQPVDLNLPHMDIVFTGVRPGEKLFEQLAYDAEQLMASAHPKINQWQASILPDADASAGLRMVADLMPLRSASADKAAVIAAISRWVPELARNQSHPNPVV